MSIFLQTCVSCGHHHYPPMLLCTRCGRADFTKTEADAGDVVVTTTVHHRINGAQETPVTLATVRIAGGPTVVARVEQPAEVGSRVSLRLRGRALWAQ